MARWMNFTISRSIRLWMAFGVTAFVSPMALNAEAKVVSGPLVVSDNWPECTDLVTWTRDIMRLEKVENTSETAQAQTFFRWLRLFSKMATGGMAVELEHGAPRFSTQRKRACFARIRPTK